MSNRVAGQALRIAAFAGLLIGSASLAGCSSLGLGLGGDVTGSTGPVNQVGGSQAMPMALQPIAPQSTRVAAGPYIPPEDIDGGGAGGLVTGSAPSGTVTTTSLPPLSGKPTMSAQPQLANPDPAPRLASLGPGTPPHNLSAVPANAYTHTIESGESLYTIARKYNVTAQALMQANSISTPDRIYVGQKLVIPGMTRPQPVVAPATRVASIAPVEAPPRPKASSSNTAVIADPAPASQAKPVQVAKADPAPVRTVAPEPKMSGADKFRWPVSGKVSTDFIGTRGTGINIDAPQGSAVRAAENGTVLYVGSGVEGYGNLILIRHPNGYVSAYAHLGSTSVDKGDNVSRGDAIGTVGMTGSVSRPQLHFELRQGATPVDPIPLLAG